MNSAAATVQNPIHTIMLSPACYKDVVRALGSKKRIFYKFDGDSFNTKIWRNEQGVLMATDPKGDRAITEMTENIVADGVGTSTKGQLLTILVKVMGQPLEAAMEAVSTLDPILKRIQAAAVTLSGAEGDAFYRTRMIEMAKIAMDMIVKIKDGHTPKLVILGE